MKHSVCHLKWEQIIVRLRSKQLSSCVLRLERACLWIKAFPESKNECLLQVVYPFNWFLLLKVALSFQRNSPLSAEESLDEFIQSLAGKKEIDFRFRFPFNDDFNSTEKCHYQQTDLEYSVYWTISLAKIEATLVTTSNANFHFTQIESYRV